MASMITTSFSHTTNSPTLFPIVEMQKNFGVEKDCFRNDPIVQNNKITQIREKTFFKGLENKAQSKEMLSLKKILQMSKFENNEIQRSLFKKEGYIKRLFSDESWTEWLEDQTALGQVASYFKDCRQSHTKIRNYLKRLDKRVIQKANEESTVLLKHLQQIPSSTQLQNSCITSLFTTAASSILTQNPLPFLFGLGECLPKTNAQQKIGNEFQINNYTIGNQMRPSIIRLSNGNFFIAWEQTFTQGGSSEGIIGQLFTDLGVKIGNEFPISIYANGSQSEPAAASSSNGKLIVTWEDDARDGSFSGIFGKLLYDNGTIIGNDFQLNNFTTGFQSAQSVASLPNNHFIAGWHSENQDGDSYGVFGQLLDENGNKLGREFQLNTHTNSTQSTPCLTGLSNGNFVAAWVSDGQDGSGRGIFGQLFASNTSKIGNEFLINTEFLNWQTEPAIARLSNNRFIVVWSSQDQDGSARGVFGQLFDNNGSKIGNEFQINTYTNESQDTPCVSELDNGNIVVIWESYLQDNSGEGIFGQLLDSNGTKIGREFQVNTEWFSGQQKPSLTNLPNDNFVVGWESNGGDGNGFGAIGQLFHDNSTYPWNPSSSTTGLSSSTSFIGTSSTSGTSSEGTSAGTTLAAITGPVSEMYSSLNNSLDWLWATLGAIGGATCLGLTGFFLNKKRPWQRIGDNQSIELGSNTNEDIRESLSPEREAKGHTKIGRKYELINKISKEESQNLKEQTGLNIQFPEGKTKAKVSLGSGNFGKIRIARDINSKIFYAVKKIKGEKAIEQSEKEGTLQNKLNDHPNIMPISGYVKSTDSQGKPVLYQFMPIASFGNGEEFRECLKNLEKKSEEKEQLLTHTAHGLLMGFLHMHKAHIFHFDMKPANIAFDMTGNLFIIDFGCAQELPDHNIQKINGDTKYFSPELLESCRKFQKGEQPPHLRAENEDAWKIGLTLYELAKGNYPFDQNDFSEKIKHWDAAYFQRKFDEDPLLKNPEPGTVLAIAKKLLDPNPETRMNIKDALNQLHYQPFSGKEKQIKAFANLKKLQFDSMEYDHDLPSHQNENYYNTYTSKYNLTPNFTDTKQTLDGYTIV